MGTPQTILRMTPEEFLEWEKTQTEKHEYLNGLVYEVYAMVGARDAHVTTAGNVFALLKEHLRGGPCRVYISDMKLQVDAANAYFYPDVFVTCDARDRAEDTRKRFPILVIEALSDSTAGYDRGDKFASYRKIEGLREYVIIDPDSFTVDCFRRDVSNHWVLYAFEGEATVELESVNLHVPLAALFENVGETPGGQSSA
ncbi:MAG: Uma2 family endonuclease [Gammaproteobacteria bacterium]